MHVTNVVKMEKLNIWIASRKERVVNGGIYRTVIKIRSYLGFVRDETYIFNVAEAVIGSLAD